MKGQAMPLVDAPTIDEQNQAQLDAQVPYHDPEPAQVELPQPPTAVELPAPVELDPAAAAEVHTDTWVVRFVVLGLMAIALAVVIGEITLLALQRDLLPGEIVVLGSAAVGGLGGVLASTRSTKQ